MNDGLKDLVVYQLSDRLWTAAVSGRADSAAIRLQAKLSVGPCSRCFGFSATARSLKNGSARDELIMLMQLGAVMPPNRPE